MDPRKGWEEARQPTTPKIMMAEFSECVLSAFASPSQVFLSTCKLSISWELAM